MQNVLLAQVGADHVIDCQTCLARSRRVSESQTCDHCPLSNMVLATAKLFVQTK